MKLIISYLILLFFKIGLTTAAVPVFSGIPSPIQVDENTHLSTLLATFTVTNPDGGTVTGCNQADTAFDIQQDIGNPTLFNLYLLGSASLANLYYVLPVTCTDSDGETATESITVDVIPNEPPAITPPTGSFTVSENEVNQREIYAFTVTDSEGDAFSCAISDVTPTPYTTAFGIWQDPTDYTCFLLNDPVLDYAVASSYAITVNCSDDYGSSLETITVDITPNQFPVFTNMPYNVSLDAQTFALGGSVFNVTATDSDSLYMNFSMTANPASPTFFEIDSVTGEITATRDLLYSTEDAYALTVTVSDSKDSTTEIVSVSLYNVNTAPIINNLDDVVLVAEDVTGGTVIVILVTSDPDVGDDEVVTYTVTPSGSYSMFSYNNATRAFSLAAGHTFDYESQELYTIAFTISDTMAETGPYTLTLNVTNVNELCEFSANTYHASLYESDIGAGSTDPGIVVTDDSGSAVLDLVATSESSYFSLVDANNISFAVNYDVDVAHPSNVTLIVRCTDNFAASSSATVSLTILDVNDNTPEFGQTGYVLYFNQYTNPGATVATLVATDLDSGDNADIEYTWSAVGSSVFYYELNSNGAVILLVDPTTTLSYGDTSEFVVTATDQGNPALSSTTTVHMVYIEQTTTTTTTEATATGFDWWDDAANVTLFVIGCILALVALALLGFLLCKYCGSGARMCQGQGDCCRQRPGPRHVGPKMDPPRNRFEFWRSNHPQIRPVHGRPTVVRPVVTEWVA